MSTTRIKLYISLLLFITVVFTVFWFSDKILSQTDNKTAVREERKETTPDVKVSGTISPLRYNGEDLKQFALSQPLPDIFLLQKENTNADSEEVKIFLPEEAKQILYRHWVRALEFRYTTEIEEASKDMEYQKKTVALVQSTQDTKAALMSLSFNFGNKTRSFSADEGSQLVIFIANTSDEVINEIRKIKNQN